MTRAGRFAGGRSRGGRGPGGPIYPERITPGQRSPSVGSPVGLDSLRPSGDRLGDRLGDQRAYRGLTQAELAELAEQCDLHRTFIGSVERGERNLSILNLRLIARALRIPMAELFAVPRLDEPDGADRPG